MSDAAPVFQKLTPMIPAGKDFQASLMFYEQKLGFGVIYQDAGMAILQRGGVEIMLQNVDDSHTASQTSLRIQIAGVNALYEEYHGAGYRAVP